MTKQTNGSYTSCTITINGAPIPDSVRVLDINTTHVVNGIPKATITIFDGDPTTGNFEVSSSATFVPGNSISIALGYDNKNTVVFNGIVTGQELRIDEMNGSTLEVECYDQAIKLTVEKKNACFTGEYDRNIMYTIIDSYPGITAEPGPAVISSPMRVQQNCSDWDFLLALAAANGMVVNCNNSTITITDPLNNTTPVLKVAYGDGLYALQAKLNSIGQHASVQVQSWNLQQQKQLGVSANASYAGPGNLDSKKLAAVVGPATHNVQANPAVAETELAILAVAQIKRVALAKITGTAKIEGTTLAAAGAFLTLDGVGDRFNGDYFISGITHSWNSASWMSTISLGMEAEQQGASLSPANIANGVLLTSGSLPQYGGSAITCDDVSKTITINDQNGNSVVLSPEGISLKSAKNITAGAVEQISMDGSKGVTINAAAGDYNVNAMNISETADIEMFLKASMIHIN